MKRNGIVAIIVVGGLVLIGGYGVLRQATWVQPADAKEGVTSTRKPAPDFQLTDLKGNPLVLSSLQGKVVLLDFWATWCPPCREEMPHFKELYAAYRGQGLEIVGVALDQGGEEVVRPFAQKNGVLYPIAIGNSRLTQAYGGIRGIPTTFLIDKKGRIAAKFVGYRPKEIFESQIKALLAES